MLLFFARKQKDCFRSQNNGVYDSTMLTIVFLSITVCLIIVYLWKIYSSYDYFKERGIPGPPHRFFFGHYKDLWSAESYSRQLEEWTRQYGTIYGLFAGRVPMYIVSDVDFLQEVYIKQFSSFHSRRLPIILRIQTGHKIHLFAATGLRWRRQRQVINPTFSAAKLKLMSPLVKKCVDAMLKKLSDIVLDKNTEINIYSLYKRMTMDVICHCAFGIDSDMQNDIDNIYLKKSAGTFATDVDKLSIVKLTDLLPVLGQPFRYFYLGQVAIRRKLIKLFPKLGNYIEETPGSWLTNRVKDVVNVRTQSTTTTTTTKRIDLLQLMIDAATNCDIQDHCDEQFMSKFLHADEVVSNVFLFMIAGYETTSTALAYSTYVLATRLDIQDKLVEEINKTEWDDNNSDDDYETAANLSYLDLFIREVLRMYPITSKGQIRECNQTTKISNYVIEKGSIIQPDIFTIHYNQDLWGPEDPNIFLPDRHAVKRHPIALMAFGVGPRNCVGMRFALMELKMCLIQLLRRYRILPGDNIEEGFNRQERLVIQPDAIFIKLEQRSM